MTCNDCIHSDVCYLKDWHYTADKFRIQLKNIEEVCIHFKDKDRLIELPCKVGDTVYCIIECSCEDIDGVHTECEFYCFGTDDNRICNIPNDVKCPYQFRVMSFIVTEMNILIFAREWGETVFFTREEAEQALKEREKNGV